MESPRIMVNIISAVYWFDDALQSRLRQEGVEPVTRPQSLLIANLSAGALRPSQLAKNLGVSRQAISQMLVELEARGLIVIENDPMDRRAKIVKFQERGVGARILNELEDELAERIGHSNVEALRRALLADWGPSPVVVNEEDAIQNDKDICKES
ncbi:MarR family transcriptional regulator [Cupriavidus sp. AcVe19-1a]|uniref:MarR family winged helix-turn-helix transcriptional regulator n=1 Tax=Cupriavidus sp. AcVe19-1a TaxID=2821359 RepID=UPI001AE3A29C|nr:MarR family transcriptional regulator [Cupriavidus sp. AcVe19-1a]MBP0630544.1 MarR family transcriptional regulator [Cupriavidus sp. AcVe19-1a]